MEYKNLHWETLDFIKAHLYHRLTKPLSQAVETLEQLQHAQNKEPGLAKLRQIQYQLNALMNTINAWATFITFKHNGPLSDFQFKEFTKADIPEWVQSYLQAHTDLRIEFEQIIEVHHDTFIEGILLLFHIARSVSSIGEIQILDAPATKNGIFVRIIFIPANDKAPFDSLSDIESQFDPDDMMERDLAIQLVVAREMMELNRAKFNLQNNKKTGQQAFTAFFPAALNSTTVIQQINAADAAAKYGKQQMIPVEAEAKSEPEISQTPPTRQTTTTVPTKAGNGVEAMTDRLIPLSPAAARRVSQTQRTLQVASTEATPADSPPQGGEEKTEPKKNASHRTTFSW